MGKRVKRYLLELSAIGFPVETVLVEVDSEEVTIEELQVKGNLEVSKKRAGGEKSVLNGEYVLDSVKIIE